VKDAVRQAKSAASRHHIVTPEVRSRRCADARRGAARLAVKRPAASGCRCARRPTIFPLGSPASTSTLRVGVGAVAAQSSSAPRLRFRSPGTSPAAPHIGALQVRVARRHDGKDGRGACVWSPPSRAMALAFSCLFGPPPPGAEPRECYWRIATGSSRNILSGAADAAWQEHNGPHGRLLAFTERLGGSA